MSAPPDPRADSLRHEDLVSAIRHELRTPLNAVLGYTQLIALHANADERQKQRAEIAIESAWQLLANIEDVLQLLAHKLQQRAGPPRPLDLTKAAHAGLAALTEQAMLADVQIERPGSASPVWALGEPALIDEVLHYAIANAIVNAGARGSVALDVACRNGRAEVALACRPVDGTRPCASPALSRLDRETGSGEASVFSAIGRSYCTTLLDAIGGRLHDMGEDSGASRTLVISLAATEPR